MHDTVKSQAQTDTGKADTHRHPDTHTYRLTHTHTHTLRSSKHREAHPPRETRADRYYTYIWRQTWLEKEAQAARS